MKRLAAPRWRIAIALLTALGLLGAGLEPLLPDTHDGDASGSTVAAASAAPNPSTPIPAHSPEAPHVCHCLHAHFAAVTATGEPLVAPTSFVEVPQFQAQSAVAAPPTRHFRPPIA